MSADMTDHTLPPNNLASAPALAIRDGESGSKTHCTSPVRASKARTTSSGVLTPRPPRTVEPTTTRSPITTGGEVTLSSGGSPPLALSPTHPASRSTAPAAPNPRQGSPSLASTAISLASSVPNSIRVAQGVPAGARESTHSATPREVNPSTYRRARPTPGSLTHRVRPVPGSNARTRLSGVPTNRALSRMRGVTSKRTWMS